MIFIGGHFGITDSYIFIHKTYKLFIKTHNVPKHLLNKTVLTKKTTILGTD